MAITAPIGTGIAADLTSTPTKDDPAKIKAAATQFEALLIGQMLKSMHDSEGGWLGTGDDASASSAMEYGQEVFAQALAQNGGLGLASMIARGLEKPAEP
ncbi:MAG TPA: hypothetical protein VMU80_18550 [Bryobacteraceae bacterium]|nr:hypothetical protein [Bryobacteraceae bacterium]